MSLPSSLHYQGRPVRLKYHKLLTGLGTHPPNSLPALREVVDGGAGTIEFDVGLTGDRRFVLLHDATLERETSGVGALRNVTAAEVKGLRLRGSEEAPATLAEVAEVLRTVERPLKVQVDLKELLPLGHRGAETLLGELRPLLRNPALTVVVGCLADWNLRALRRLEPELRLGLDVAYHLDAPVDGLVRLPSRLNAYGYLDDHPLGFRRLLPVAEYLHDRLEALLGLVPAAVEFYLRKEFVAQARGDGFDAVACLRELRPDALIDIWTLDWTGSNREELIAALEAGADQITTNTALQWAQQLA